MNKFIMFKNRIILFLKKKIILFLFTNRELDYLIELAECNEKDAFRERVLLPHKLIIHYDFKFLSEIVLKLKLLSKE